MKSRFLFSAFCMLVAMTMATGAFAQSATFQVSSGATQGRMNGHTELAGGITLSSISGSFLAGEADAPAHGTVRIDFGVPVTNAIDDGDADTTDNGFTVMICDVDGAAANTKVDGNTITLTVLATNACDTSAVIDLDNVRLSLVGSGRDSVEASVTSTGDVRLLGGAVSVTVVNSVVDELTDDGIEVVDTLTLIRHTGRPDDAKKFKLLIMENTVRSFDNAEINLEFSGIPDDISVTIDAWVAQASQLETEGFIVDQTLNLALPTGNEARDEMNAQLSVDTPGNLTATLTAEENEASVLTGQLVVIDDPDTSGDDENEGYKGGMFTEERDVIIVLGTISGATDEEVIPLELDIQVTADVGPAGVAKPKGSQSKAVPRFASDKTTAVTVIESTSAQTKFLVPYAAFSAIPGGYDTGFSIANTTSGEMPQYGVVTFSFPGDATLEDFATEMVGPGQNVTLLLSEILGQTAYTGQVMVTANFTGAEGVAFVSDFLTFTSASPLIKK